MRNIALYRPTGVKSLWNEMDSLFNSMLTEGNGNSFPKVDIREEQDHYFLEAELPGMTEKDVDVSIDNNLLTISSARKEENEEKKEGYLVRERKQRSFARSFVLPRDVEKDKIEASYKNGLLTLDIPKSEKAKPRTIEVKSN
ncbi:MAG: Hsp20/alpha crystallin family protein [Spirochaetales bacterium]|nr:Hsp20/alpha crystallin family protein [Spirochaetales bacterium]MCF7938802.1 Hsp20/alpha crystallin family protein [Spirochaetales bacterium]